MRYAEGVNELVGAGIEFGTLEREIERTPVGPDQRDAMWLHAWSACGLRRHGRPLVTVPVPGREVRRRPLAGAR